MLARGERLRLSLTSEDMKPAVLPGDLVEFEEAQLMRIRRGDLVLLYAKGHLRLRRVLSRLTSSGGEFFLLGADALPEGQSRHGFQEILAKVVSIERDGEVLRPAGDAPWNARLRRRLKLWLRNVWHSFLLMVSKKND